MGLFMRLGVAVAVSAVLVGQSAPVLALPVAPAPETDAQISQVRHGGPHHPGLGGHRPVHRPPAYRPPVHVRPGYHGGWHRPHYRWRPGGAIAAGAALGFLSAAAAAAYATSAAPAPGLCWYYTDASRRAGFWDACP